MTFAIAGLAVLACSAPRAYAEAVPYIVEILVFAHTGPDAAEGELPGATSPQPVDAAEPTAVLAPSARFAQHRRLLEADPNYTVLYHNRWRQRLETRSTAQPVRIRNADLLDGYIRVYRGRYLQLDIELYYTPAGPVRSGWGAWFRAPAATRHYVLREHRRLRRAKLNYLDHPRFGVLVEIDEQPAGGPNLGPELTGLNRRADAFRRAE